MSFVPQDWEKSHDVWLQLPAIKTGRMHVIWHQSDCRMPERVVMCVWHEAHRMQWCSTDWVPSGHMRWTIRQHDPVKQDEEHDFWGEKERRGKKTCRGMSPPHSLVQETAQHETPVGVIWGRNPSPGWWWNRASKRNISRTRRREVLARNRVQEMRDLRGRSPVSRVTRISMSRSKGQKEEWEVRNVRCRRYNSPVQ